MTKSSIAFVTATASALALLAACIIGLHAIALTTNNVQSNCQQIEVLKSAIRTSITDSAKQLGQPGSAGFAYYRAHPTELKAARAATLSALHQFQALPCP